MNPPPRPRMELAIVLQGFSSSLHCPAALTLQVDGDRFTGSVTAYGLESGGILINKLWGRQTASAVSPSLVPARIEGG